ncbi:hypothetical protein GCM10023213_46580 [Prosthecobacter algae]|uniref:YHS domain-containing protein n=1 Tax=Prosthecobacter algae TaxID=1144682 RepID=A0ABP9PN88_9BACT
MNTKAKLTLAIMLMLVLLPASWITYSRHAARVYLSDGDTSLKDIGFFPASGEMYAEGVGFVDSTLYYQASVTPEEVTWLDRIPAVTSIEAPPSSPLWWRLALWWHGRSSSIRYFRTAEKWPCIYAYSKEAGIIFGTVEYD